MERLTQKGQRIFNVAVQNEMPEANPQRQNHPQIYNLKGASSIRPRHHLTTVFTEFCENMTNDSGEPFFCFGLMQVRLDHRDLTVPMTAVLFRQRVALPPPVLDATVLVHNFSTSQRTNAPSVRQCRIREHLPRASGSQKCAANRET